jgi:subtilisin family serine protease
MIRRSTLLLLATLLAACAPAPTMTASLPPEPADEPATETTRPDPAPPTAQPMEPATETTRPDPAPPTAQPMEPEPEDPGPAPLARAPDAWQLLDLDADRVPGVSAARAYDELLAGRSPAREVIVAVIDGGIDTAHVDLRENLWRNPGETAGNGVDDDGNGYVDDVYGWNFIGGPDGRSVGHETLEVTRLHAACQAGETITVPESCAQIAAAYDEERGEVDQTLQVLDQIDAAYAFALPLLTAAGAGDPPTVEAVQALTPMRQDVIQARSIFLQLAPVIPPEDVPEAREAYEGLDQYGLALDFDPRDIVGDDFSDGDERSYGNGDVMGPDAMHGTHVAGIIGAVRGNGVGMDGIASSVRLMTIRTVPDGDERDKDVANAIRYAVDNGAHVINMSFGKSYSPRKELVDAAIRYADEHGVLMIHAAGNDGENVDVESNYPTPVYGDGVRASNWIEVGAASWQVDSLAAAFSNYGQTTVDAFAPGVDILSTVPGGEWKREDGTSMAAPVVTGVAALLMAYFPDLDAAEVRRILLESSVKYGDRMVPQPGGGDLVPFGTLSVTGGVVNAYEAVRMALERM